MYHGDLEVSVEGELVVLLVVGHDAHLLVLAHSLLKEIGLALERNDLHEVKGVGNLVHLKNCDFIN